MKNLSSEKPSLIIFPDAPALILQEKLDIRKISLLPIELLLKEAGETPKNNVGCGCGFFFWLPHRI